MLSPPSIPSASSPSRVPSASLPSISPTIAPTACPEGTRSVQIMEPQCFPSGGRGTFENIFQGDFIMIVAPSIGVFQFSVYIGVDFGEVDIRLIDASNFAAHSTFIHSFTQVPVFINRAY